MSEAAYTESLRWHYDSLPYDEIERERIVDDQLMFYALATASFIEITSDLYTRNLVDFFADRSDIREWLDGGWEPEELQHGHALRRYVMQVWPDFDWDTVYQGFFDDYSTCCTAEALGETRPLELVRRCIVETGTCSYYEMLRRASPCPVLTQLTSNIRSDEASHYKHFFDYFRSYDYEDVPTRRQIMGAIIERIREIEGEDGFIAFRHVWQALHPNATFKRRHYREFSRSMRQLAKQHYPFRMAAHMATQPMGLSMRAQQRTDRAVAATGRFVVRLSS